MLFKGAFKTDNTNIEYKKKSGGVGGSDLKHELITTTKIKKSYHQWRNKPLISWKTLGEPVKLPVV